jgi:hypothetical protein
MSIICIAGTSSGVGKTTVACGLLRYLPGWAAIKVTRCHLRGPCPHQRGCNVCMTLTGSYQLREMTSANDVSGKDTWRLREAGASRVLWLIAQPEAVERGLKKALARLKSAPGVVVEGNAAVPWLGADLVVMVKRQAGDKLSPSALTAAFYTDQTFFLDEPKLTPRVDQECRRSARLVTSRAREKVASGGLS